MPIYHFNVYDGSSSIDAEGTDIQDWPSARMESVRLAGQILNFEPTIFASHADWRMEVTDASGLMMMRLDFLVTESPAAIRDNRIAKNAPAASDSGPSTRAQSMGGKCSMNRTPSQSSTA